MAVFGYIRQGQGHDAETQRQFLSDAGVSPQTIYTDAGLSGQLGVGSRKQLAGPPQ